MSKDRNRAGASGAVRPVFPAFNFQHSTFNSSPMAQPEAPKIIFSMLGVSKKIERKEIIRDISLSFYYGAKIGVLGLNGSGKSTLLRIMAGIDEDYLGETIRAPGYAVGLLEQEPKLDPNKTVKEVVEEAVQPIVDLLAKYEEINEKFSD